MARFFTIQELTKSATAEAHRIDNDPSTLEIVALSHLMEKVLDPIRIKFGAPITVTSGYRSRSLNAAVGGVPASQHVKGEAADITVGSPTRNKELFDLICEMQLNGDIKFDQLIDERNYRWIHISARLYDNRGEILHL